MDGWVGMEMDPVVVRRAFGLRGRVASVAGRGGEEGGEEEDGLGRGGAGREGAGLLWMSGWGELEGGVGL